MKDAPDTCRVLSAGLVAAYAAARLDLATAWSVEAHVPDCAACRTELATSLDAARLRRNRDVLMTRLSLPEPGPAARVLRRCGVPEHVVALLAATPSLRRSWFAGVVLVLGVVAGLSEVAARQAYRTFAGPSWWEPFLPFLVIAPLLPLAAVAVAFGRMADPAYLLAVAAPVSKAWLLTVRAAAVIAATLVPTVLVALILPGPDWLAAVILLPSLAICVGALALATVTGPSLAVLGSAACWIGVVVAVYTTLGRPSAVFGATGQAAAAVILAVSLVALAHQRRAVDYGRAGW